MNSDQSQESRRNRLALLNEASKRIDEQFISALVDNFYSNIQNHELLGPIFDERINGNWDPHLSKMKDFWSSIVLYTRKYSGEPMQAHLKLSAITESHFEAWLELFEQTLKELSSDDEVRELFMHKAKNISRSIQAAISAERSTVTL